MTTPTFTLPTSGSDPKRATKEGLEENINQIIKYLDDMRIKGDAALMSGLEFQGGWDAATGTFPATNKDGGTVSEGDLFWVASASSFGGNVYSLNEPIVALVDNPSTTDEADWYHTAINPSLDPLISRIDEMSVPFTTVSEFESANITDLRDKVNATSGTVFVSIQDGDRTFKVDLAQVAAFDETNANGVEYSETSGAQLQSSEIKTVGEDSRSVVLSPDYNRFADDISQSFLAGGSVTQPNAIGKSAHAEYFTGDGVTTAFTATLPFSLVLETWVHVRANVARISDGLVTNTYSEGVGITVTNYGSTPTVTFNTAPALDSTIELTFYSNTDDGVASLQNITGYDNSSSAIASNINSHHSIIFPGNGHNNIDGGSFHRIWGSYNIILGGNNCRIGRYDKNSISCVAVGRSLEVDGSQMFVGGLNNRARGNNGFVWGLNHIVNDHDDVRVTGRGAATRSDGERVHGAGIASDTDRGLRQVSAIAFSKDTTDATTTSLQVSSGATNYSMPNTSASTLEVSGVAIKDDGTKMQMFSGQFFLTKDAAGTGRINGTANNVVVPVVQNVGTPSYVMYVRAIGNNLTVRVEGEVGENVRWTADCRMVQASWT